MVPAILSIYDCIKMCFMSEEELNDYSMPYYIKALRNQQNVVVNINGSSVTTDV